MNLSTQTGEYRNALERLFRVQHSEWVRFGLAFAYFFCLLGGYFMIRPIRGTVAANEHEVLPWLYTATFTCMLLLVPVFGWLVARFRRAVFIPVTYIFFLLQMGFFALAFREPEPSAWIQRGFYVWLSVFNLFVVSVFWSFMADIFRPGQAQRLFGSLMAGGSLGAICGPLVTRMWVSDVGSSGILAMAMGGLLLATLLAIALGRYEAGQKPDAIQSVIGGGVLQGAVEVFRSRYLLLICLLMLSHNLVSTLLYNGMAVLVDQNIDGFDRRTEFFSNIDLAVQLLAFTLQFFVTSRLVKHLGMPGTALLPPVLLAGGLVILGGSMGVVLFAGIQVLQRAMNYGLLGPVKEMLFTVVDREAKYKSKNFIDTVVYRGSDVTASWLFKGLLGTGAGLGSVVLMYLPIMGIWGLGAWKLGKAYEQLKRYSESSEKDG